ncbi:MAG: protein kinase, partial [Planctomycetaceae bacterium]|nr:protein kinase [Planctomycetaceae bacterium]
MQDPSIRNPAYLTLTTQQLFEIDVLCDRFDQELMDGQGPRMESFLAEAPVAAQDGLLAELLAMELEYRAQQGAAPEPDEYFHRFPQQRSILEAVFAHEMVTQFGGHGKKRSISDEVPPDLDDFRPIKVLGRGGMGVVWLAEQIQPVKRRVALKLIKADVPSKGVTARFEAEKQALAMMEHPNIARVLDGGTTDDGRPYFVMELVDGIPITQYCDDNKLSVDERLSLFVSVCKAVQHAHQKGIVHRDLKPSNVLVAVIDGAAVPKVIDFGLAKAVEQDLMLSDMTIQTEFGKVVGTLQYMSPEQAELNSVETRDLDTRTDIYSLGVILYELLTGSTPVDKQTLGQNALLKILEIIREKDPPRPSSRLSSSSHEANSAVSSLRRLHPARLQQLLRGELDWVVMKALEKDRTRRYQTANDLAQDLSNYLTGETVTARPPSTWYQARKFARRNRGLVAALFAIGVALVCGIAGTTYGLIQANEQTTEANEQRKFAEEKSEEADEERQKALASEQVALQERDNAQRNAKRAVAAEERSEAEADRARDSEAAAKFQLANARWDAGRARDARDLLHEIPEEYRNNFEWHFCNRKFDGSDLTCYGHSMLVRDVAFSPDGTRIATASMDSSIKLWDATSGQEIQTLRGHQGTVDQVIFSLDGTRLATRSSDRTIKIWDPHSGQSMATLKGDQNSFVEIAFSPDGEELLSVSSSATIWRWDVSTGQLISRSEGREQGVGGSISPDGLRFLSIDNSAIILWDAITGREIARQVNAVLHPRSSVFSSDGRHLAIAGHDIVTLWDADLSQKLWAADGKAGWIRGLCFSPDGTRLASAGGARKVQVWDVRSGWELMTLVGHDDEVGAVAFSPDGSRLASAGLDTTLKVWDVRTGVNAMSIHAHEAVVDGIVFCKDGERLASVSFDRKLKFVDVRTGREIYSVNGFYHGAGPGSHTVAMSPDESCIAFGADDNTVKIISAETGAQLKSLNGHESTICTVAYSPNGKRLVSGGFDHTARMWDVDSGKEIATLRGHTGRVNCVAFSPDGTRLVSACEDLTIKFWDAESGEEIRSLTGHQVNVVDVVFSLNGSQIATSSSDHTIRIWDSLTGEELSRLKGHEAGVTGIAFSPDGRRLASTSFDRKLKLWDVQNRREVTTLYESPSGVHAVAFRPDGRRIAVGTGNGAILFFDAPEECEATPLTGHNDEIVNYGFSDDGHQLYSESKNERLLWNLATKEHEAISNGEPPAESSTISPDGRWLINRDRHHLLLIDLEYKNTPREKNDREAKARFDPRWHQEQARAAAKENNWYSAAFHFAWLKKSDPESFAYDDGLQTYFPELQSQFQQQGRDLDVHLASVVKEALKIPSASERDNPSFEEPRIRRRGFELRRRIPGWKTTSDLFEIWSTGFFGVDAYDGEQFAELNAREVGTLYRDLTDIERGAAIEFTFAHRGRNGEDTLKLTITDLGADNVAGGEDDQELFSKEYNTGKDAWATYDSTAEPTISALGNQVRVA